MTTLVKQSTTQIFKSVVSLHSPRKQQKKLDTFVQGSPFGTYTGKEDNFKKLKK